ncbi:MAG: Clp protease N-terminal domain-containing protein [Acidimicrobiales bacterium]
MFERFTTEARQLIVAAQVHARRRGHTWIGCEHLLLAVAGSDGPAGQLLRDRGVGPDAVSSRIEVIIGPGRGDADESAALATLGIDLDRVREAVEARFGPGALDRGCDGRRRQRRGLWRRRRPAPDGHPSRPAFTPRAKRCLELSLKEALKLHHHHIGVEHVALALLARDDTMAARILADLNLARGHLREEILRTLRKTA